MRKILYVEDMEECFEKTKKVIGKSFELDWKRNYSEAINAIIGNLEIYSAAIFDVNLKYEPNLKNNEQTKRGLSLIKISKEMAKKQNLFIPILCVSSDGTLYKKLALEAGADKFVWKKEFWEGKGREILENLIKKV